jgi:hypothetical protein
VYPARFGSAAVLALFSTVRTAVIRTNAAGH